LIRFSEVSTNHVLRAPDLVNLIEFSIPSAIITHISRMKMPPNPVILLFVMFSCGGTAGRTAKFLAR
jgi:hypothetical protein